MSDLAQPGLITTLPWLHENSAALEAKLTPLARATPIALILPCHAGELGSPALSYLLDEIAGVDFLREIVISLNGHNSQSVKEAQDQFARLPQPHRILWNDAPEARIFPKSAPGKGRNVWAAVGLLAQEKQCRCVALLDCDVTTFRREMLVRLCFACVHPELNFSFAKMYYSRIASDGGRIYGRVSRLFLAPLLQALVRVAGHQPLLDFLLSFRYPLAGEAALRLDLAATLPFDAGWGLEIGLLCEIFRRVHPREICQIAGGHHYDHKHQPLGLATRTGLYQMSRELALTLLPQLVKEGLPVEATFLEAVSVSYQHEAAAAVARTRRLALLNGLHFDEAEENQHVTAFTQAWQEAAAQFLTGAPSHELPAWDRIDESS